MPLDIARLFGSEFHAHATDSEWRAGVTLWLKSFHQKPAGSLPDSDIALARLAELGRDLRTWKRLRQRAMRGWVLCSDGRFYHRVVAEKVNEAWAKKHAMRERGKRGNEKRWSRVGSRDEPQGGESSQDGGTHRDADVLSPDQKNTNEINERPVLERSSGDPAGIAEGSQEDRVTILERSLKDRKGQGQGQRELLPPSSLRSEVPPDEFQRPTPPKRDTPKKPERGHRLPADWQPSDVDRQYAAKEGLSPEQIDREAERFRDHWHSTTGRNAVKLNWSMAWRNWVREAVDRLNRGRPQRPAPKAYVC